LPALLPIVIFKTIEAVRAFLSGYQAGYDAWLCMGCAGGRAYGLAVFSSSSKEKALFDEGLVTG
jgi:hypothetical protein